MTNSSGRTATYTLVIVKRKAIEKLRAKSKSDKLYELLEKEVEVIDQYYVFATTMPKEWIDGDPLRVAEHYRIRWGIENSYKSYEDMRPRTTSRQYSVRFLLLISPFVLYNIWILALFKAARRAALKRKVSKGPSPVTLASFSGALLDAVKE